MPRCHKPCPTFSLWSKFSVIFNISAFQCPPTFIFFFFKQRKLIEDKPSFVRPEVSQVLQSSSCGLAALWLVFPPIPSPVIVQGVFNCPLPPSPLMLKRKQSCIQLELLLHEILQLRGLLIGCKTSFLGRANQKKHPVGLKTKVQGKTNVISQSQINKVSTTIERKSASQ